MTTEDAIRASLLDPAVLRQLLRRLEATDVDELEITYGSARLYLRREPRRRLAEEAAGVRRPEAATRLPAAAAGRKGESAAAPATDGTPVAAPLTGVFYSRSTPEKPPYVAPGDIIVSGQVVGLIETMKLFNEVTAEVAGAVLAVSVEDGDLVEAGQPLMYIDVEAGGVPFVSATDVAGGVASESRLDEAAYLAGAIDSDGAGYYPAEASRAYESVFSPKGQEQV